MTPSRVIDATNVDDRSSFPFGASQFRSTARFPIEDTTQTSVSTLRGTHPIGSRVSRSVLRRMPMLFSLGFEPPCPRVPSRPTLPTQPQLA
jgi:hypothetical protein